MNLRAKFKGFLLFLSIFYLTVYIPLVLMIYFSPWYELNCNWHTRCEQLGYENSLKLIDNLTDFFRHGDELKTRWTDKETLHLTEVRGIFDRMFVGGIIALVLLILMFDRKRVSRFSVINAVIILSFILILPFFTYFWVHIFHPLIFDNDLWKNNPVDISYYIMPRQFFKYSTLFLVIVCFLINLSFWLIFRKRETDVAKD